VPAAAAAEVARHVGTNREAIARLLFTDSHENELRSGLFTAAAYLVGAFFPLVPYFFSAHAFTALWLALLLAGLALLAVAVLISMFSGISLHKKALEMVLSAFVAAGLSFAFGKALESFTGVSL
jgi:VIT1/CCC1 family predicted Fe2+/Mn2+ transporter